MDSYRYTLYTSADRSGPVFAAAPGRWRQVDAATVAAMIRYGECAPQIHRVHDVNLARMRAVCTGGNS